MYSKIFKSNEIWTFLSTDVGCRYFVLSKYFQPSSMTSHLVLINTIIEFFDSIILYNLFYVVLCCVTRMDLVFPVAKTSLKFCVDSSRISSWSFLKFDLDLNIIRLVCCLFSPWVFKIFPQWHQSYLICKSRIQCSPSYIFG